MEKLLFDKKKEHNYYEILNCDPSSSKEQITTEYRLLCRKYHPDKAEDNGNDNDTEQYCRISKAYKVLSDDKQRKDYTKWMGCGLSVSYERWKELSTAAHTSLHWGTVKSQLALEDYNETSFLPYVTTTTTTTTTTTESHTTLQQPTQIIHGKRSVVPTPDRRSLVSKFRKYQI